MLHNTLERHFRANISLRGVFKIFPNSTTAEKWLAEQCWGTSPTCPYCGSRNVQSGAKHKTMPYRCREKQCSKRFSVKTGTIMQSSNLDYQVWAIAIYLMATNMKGISSMKLHRDLNITQKSAWHLAHRLRKSWEAKSMQFSGIVDMDKNYIGRKDKESDRVITQKVKNTNKGTLHGVVPNIPDKSSAAYTNNGRGYSGMIREHEMVEYSINAKHHDNSACSMSNLIGKVHNKDCLELMRSIAPNSINMIFADPPFNLNKKYNTYKDNLDFFKYMEWTKIWLRECSRILRNDGSLFLYNIPKLLTYTTPILNDLLEFRHWITWNANGQPLGKTLQPAHYGILFYTKTKDSKYYNVRAPHPKCRKCDSYLKDYGGKEHLRHPFGYQISDVWGDIHRVRHNSKRVPKHPCQLPVHLIERLLLMSTDEGDIIFDPFCGSGSAAVAAKQMGRRYIGTEIDSYYAKASNDKYQQASEVTGNNGEYISVHLGKIVSIRNIDYEKMHI